MDVPHGANTKDGDLVELARFVFDRNNEPGEVVLHDVDLWEAEAEEDWVKVQTRHDNGALPMASKEAPPAYKIFHVMFELFLYGVKLHNGAPLDQPLPAWNEMSTTTLPFVTRRMEMAFGVTPHLSPADANIFAHAPGRYHFKKDANDAAASSVVDCELMLEIRFTFGLPLQRYDRRV